MGLDEGIEKFLTKNSLTGIICANGASKVSKVFLFSFFFETQWTEFSAKIELKVT